VAFLKEYQKQFLFDEGSEPISAPAPAQAAGGAESAPMDAAEDDDDDL